MQKSIYSFFNFKIFSQTFCMTMQNWLEKSTVILFKKILEISVNVYRRFFSECFKPKTESE